MATNATDNNSINTTNGDNNDTLVPNLVNDTGILKIKRGDGYRDLPVGREIVLNVHSTIIDRYEGTVVTEPIWADRANIRVVTAAAASAELSNVCAEFFLSRAITKVLIAAIQTRTIRPADVMLTKAELFGFLESAPSLQNKREATAVIMELVTPYLIKVGVLSNGGNYSKRFAYTMGAVTVKEITQDVAMSEIVRVMETSRVVNITDKKYSREVFAEEVGDALFDIGRKFLEVNNLSVVIDDIVKGVRAYIDVSLAGMKGYLDDSWRSNDVIATLATNWVFIEAALNLPVGSDITPSNEGWKLDKYAPGLLAAIKSSARFAIVGRAEVMRNLGMRKVRDLRGRPVTSVLWRAANPDAVGMSVYAYEDAMLKGAFTLTHTKERLGEVIAAAYNRPADLGTTNAARMLVSLLTDAAQAGYDRMALLYSIDLGAYATVQNSTVIALLAQRVSVCFDESGIIERETTVLPGDDSEQTRRDIKLWYQVNTTEKDMSWGLTGRYDQTSYLTSDVGEAFLAMDEFEPSSVVDAKPQLYSATAFNTRIVNFDERSLTSIEDRFTFNVEVYDAKVHGSFRASDLGSMRSNPNTSVVVPAFNHEVFTAVARTFTTMFDIAADMARQTSDTNPNYVGGPNLPTFLERRTARDVLMYAQKLSPAFRAEVHRGMMTRAVRNLTAEQSVNLRARLAQRAFGAYADVAALSLFIQMQGMDDTSNFWSRIVSDNAMAATYFEVESDRDAERM